MWWRSRYRGVQLEVEEEVVKEEEEEVYVDVEERE